MIRLLLILGFSLLALGGLLYYDSLPPPLCTFNNEEYDLSNLNSDSEGDVLFTITNPTNEIVRIVGLADC